MAALLRVIDVSKFQLAAPDYSGYDNVIVNITPQNIYRDAQIAKARAEGKGIGYYTWPLSFAGDWNADAVACAQYILGLIAKYGEWARGPVFQDYETGSFSGNPVGPGLAWAKVLHSNGLGAHDYVQYSLINSFDWSSHVAAGINLWFAEYTSSPDTAFGPWPYATGWQKSDHRPDGGGGDDSDFYCDENAWHALGFPPGVGTAPQSLSVTPIGGFLMALTDEQQATILAAAQTIQDYIRAPQFKVDIFTGTSPQEVAARDAFAKGILNTEIPWYGFGGAVPASGRKTTTPGLDAGWNDTRQAQVVNLINGLVAQINALSAVVAKGAGVDEATLKQVVDESFQSTFGQYQLALTKVQETASAAG